MFNDNTIVKSYFKVQTIIRRELRSRKVYKKRTHIAQRTYLIDDHSPTKTMDTSSLEPGIEAQVRKTHSVRTSTLKTNSWLLGLYLCFGLVISESSDCNCPGPIAYYNAIECTPEFKNREDCCPQRYNCDHLENLPTDKCFVNGRTYDIGEKLKNEDSNPCDIGCTCTQGVKGPTFNCAIVDCFYGPVKPGCYRQNSPMECCSGKEVCPENPEDRATCIVDGKTYKDGEYFQSLADPNKNCVCAEGYTGEDVEPFCVLPKRSYCSPIFRHMDLIRENCAPVYYSTQSPNTSCSVFSRCLNDADIVIARTANDSESAIGETSNPDMLCKFGNLTMQVGDELNQATDYSSVCVKCVCEVPPVPTCQRLPDEECDVTKHPNFSTESP